ncbi:choice-of-anchor I family protein [Paenibacillus koleovorans]|uniref:choice-of-anchor I family protein n=1 Tax=Paenibacillus koleovorans TaxID=121608 RepID=UPI000FD766E4|nr:choice-of-anchor I family protein [Paenibacillus koleovorans]
MKLKRLAATLAATVTIASVLGTTPVFAADVIPTPPTATGELVLTKIARYDSMKVGAGTEKNGVEIVNFDPISKKAFLVNGDANHPSMEIIDFSSLTTGSVTDIVYGGTNGNLLTRIPIRSLGESAFFDVTSIAIHPTQDLLAVAVLAEKPNKGYVAFFNKNGQYLKKVEAGYHPDMIMFTSDGNTVLVANEGEPTDNTYADDPKGSVTIVDVSGGINSVDQSKVTDVTFDELTIDDIDPNVRIFPFKDGVYHKRSEFPNGNNWSVDFEPEYITVSGNIAYVSLQENNAIAKLDLTTKKFTHVYGLGYKDHTLPGNEIDLNEKDGINIINQPVLGAYMPDGITSYQVGGKTYIVTANEGDSREYIYKDASGHEITVYTEEKKLNAIKSLLQFDASKFGNYTQDQFNTWLNTINGDSAKVTTAVYDAAFGETGSATHSVAYTFGARSFSIWDADNISAGPVYDSGSNFESITATMLPDYFNYSNDGNKKDKRSSSKGPEPEDVKLGVINGKTYSFVGLERIGGVMVYDVTNPMQPSFVTYKNDRDFTKLDHTTDLGPEGMNFVPADKSPTGKPLLFIAHEISGTLLVYEISSANYQVTGQADDAYMVGAKTNGITTLTVNSGKSGWVSFSASVASVIPNPGSETLVFKHVRNNTQIGLAAVRQDYDGSAQAAQAQFNVQAGDVVEVYIVDNLTNDPTKQPVVLQ